MPVPVPPAVLLKANPVNSSFLQVPPFPSLPLLEQSDDGDFFTSVFLGLNRNAAWDFQGSHVYFSRPTETDPYVVSHEIFLVSCHQLYIDDEHC